MWSCKQIKNILSGGCFFGVFDGYHLRGSFFAEMNFTKIAQLLGAYSAYHLRGVIFQQLSYLITAPTNSKNFNIQKATFCPSRCLSKGTFGI